MDLGLKDKVALCTGAGTGINRVIALTFAQEGANVAINDLPVRPDLDKKWMEAIRGGSTLEDAIGKEAVEKWHGLHRGEAVAEECRRLGVKSIFAPADVTDSEQVKAMVKRVIDELGKIDILVNGAGGDLLGAGDFANTEKKQWEYAIDLCLYGMLNCTRAVLPHMIERRYGKVCSLLSDAWKGADRGQSVYGGCKAAISSISRTLAVENGRYGINFNCVSPGATDSEALQQMEKKRFAGKSPEEVERIRKAQLSMYALGRFYGSLGKREDLANMVVFMCSERARWVTGQTISVSGGYHMHQ
jgi:2-hydroxycyclohexanecarboxyl-CoA dehydrogenase